MSSDNNFNIAVFVSGSGTNLQAIIDSKIDSFQIAVIVCNNPEAYAIERARKHNIPIEIINHKEFDSRQEFEVEIISRLENYNINLIVLAGFMRVLTEFFVGKYKNKIINIHPALLPSFPGMHAARQALEYGVKYTGVTVHFVDHGVDTGPIIFQAVVPISEDDTEQTLLEKLHKEEHSIYPLAIKLISENKLIISGRNIKTKS